MVVSSSTILSPPTDGFSSDDTLTSFPRAMFVSRDTGVPLTVMVLVAIADVIHSSFTAMAFTVAESDTANVPSYTGDDFVGIVPSTV